MKLKPCPFCGGIARVRADTFIWVECQRCKCCTSIRRTVEYAQRAWNRRLAAQTKEK